MRKGEKRLFTWLLLMQASYQQGEYYGNKYNYLIFNNIFNYFTFPKTILASIPT